MKIFSILLLLGISFGFGGLAAAHGPTPQKVDESVEINAPIDKVWAVLQNFAAIDQWHPMVAKSSGNGGNTAGAARTLALANGEQWVEELDHYDAATHEYSYRLRTPNLLAMPVSSYSATLRLTAAAQKTTVTWKSRLYRGDTSNFPPDDLNDEAAVGAMQRFVRVGLDRLKTMLE